MNIRTFLHVVGALAAAIAGGTVVFAGLSEDMTKNLVSIAVIIGIVVNAYLGATTTGVSRGSLPE